MNEFVSGDSILRIRHCGHIFREMNLRRHFRNNTRCPICRYDIRDYIQEENDYSSNGSNINENIRRTGVSENFMNSLDRDILDIVENALNSIGNDPSGNTLTTDIIYQFT
jgi:hypothetical protein